MNSVPTNSDLSAIETFRHVQQRICALWGSHELNAYTNHLLTDSRDGQRRGFPMEASAELLFLAELNKLVRALDLARRLKIQLGEAYAKIDKQDRGADLGDPANSLLGRDAYARAGRAQPRTSLPMPERMPAGGGRLAMLGKWVLLLVALGLAYHYLLPLIMK